MSSEKSKLKSFYCIEYPGYVENEENAMKTLGGIDRIQQCFQRSNSKLLLNFTPDNMFSKMLCSTTPNDSSSISNDAIISSNQSGSSSRASETLSESTLTPENSKSFNLTQSNNFNETVSIPCLLMSVRKLKKSKSNTSKDSESKFEAKIIGNIRRIYSFQKIADFQYLPMCSTSSKSTSNESTTNGANKSFTFNAFYDNLLFKNIENYEYELKKNSIPQLFILPPFFSRFDDPVNYAFRSEPNQKHKQASLQAQNSNSSKKSNSSDSTKQWENDKTESSTSINLEIDGTVLDDDKQDEQNKEEQPNELIRSMRQERSSQALLVTFDCQQIPIAPNEKLKTPRSPLIRECISKLNELFAKRPCFLKSVLLCITNFSASVLKETLPYVAYYFTTGPWRSCWVRFGYDPRIDPDARIYQMIDYRLRCYSEREQKVKTKPRSSYHKRKFRSDLSENESDDYKNVKMEEEMYKFNANKLPTSRNVFYQLCDIEDEEVQEIINNLSNRALKCSKDNGWFSNGIQDACRNMMNKKHEKLFKTISKDQTTSISWESSKSRKSN